ncbi:GNAT family N-acetyltransferase [Leekyejoonella antrihumi]|uniref:GNAT family N-acetyltransferase n=1 Tax=Leekyejoonella antrihumi TaxID=1660198 RepID=A0A563DZD6_9MICO|nr:GNAT family N-acetyltransferase [Leekyejoonella antrihumi]TWP35596.1 GNAT family N-acetyltransferase [Leekyejoonella antrihumi]
MTEITARTLEDGDWPLYQRTRLAALADATDMVDTFLDPAGGDAAGVQDGWHHRVIRTQYIVAECGHEPVGLVCLGLHENPEAGEVFGLWTAPGAPGDRVARTLMTTAARNATENGCRLLYFWAGSDDATAISFASGFGFRPMDERRPARVTDGDSQTQAFEVAMMLAL